MTNHQANPTGGLEPTGLDLERKLLVDRIFSPWLNPGNSPEDPNYEERTDLLLGVPEASSAPAPSSRDALVRGEDLLTLAPPQHWERTCSHCWLIKPEATFGSDGLCADCTHGEA